MPHATITTGPDETIPQAARPAGAYYVLGERVRVLTSSDETGGAYAAGEVTVAPGGGPPPHRHRHEDELFYVVDGELEFVRGGDQLRGRAGDAVFLPRGVPHAFKNVGGRPARFFLLATPGGFDRFVAAVGTPTDPADPFAPPRPTDGLLDKVIAGAAAAGIEMLFDHRAAAGPADVTGRAEAYWLLGQHVRLKLTSADTNGQFGLTEVVTPPGGFVPPHRHLGQDELFYVLDGEYAFEVDGARRVAAAGTYVRVPRGAWHTFANTGATPARLLDLHTGGGFEGFVRDLGAPCAADAAAGSAAGLAASGPPPEPPPADRVLRAILKHGMEVPPLG